jgi:hypothetical protein
MAGTTTSRRVFISLPSAAARERLVALRVLGRAQRTCAGRLEWRPASEGGNPLATDTFQSRLVIRCAIG